MKTVIAKVTHSCNLQCKYCCVGDVAEKGIMSEETLSNLIKKTAQANSDGETAIIWHGGEPLLVGLGFYKKVVELQKTMSNHIFHNSIQTNGTLLNNEFLDFFETHNFRVGLSLDGCKETHESNRPYKNGKSSFEDTSYWIKELKKRNIGGGAICVLNKNTASKIDEIYHFSKEDKVSFKYNPQYPAGRAIVNDDLGLLPDELANAYIRLFDLWFNDNHTNRPKVDFFESTIDNIAAINSDNPQRVRPYDCAFKNQCQHSFLAVSPAGNIYPCGKFVDDKDFLYGNINENCDLPKILEKPTRAQFLERHKGVAACESCKYKPLCNSGCPNISYLLYGSIMHKNPYCEAYKKLYEHIENILIVNGKRKDIYLIPSSQEDKFIVYSPLRRVSFFVNAKAAEIINGYIVNGTEIPQEYHKLYKHFQKMEGMIIREPKEQGINIHDNAVILLSQKCNLACSYCYAQSARSQDTLSKEKIKIIVNYLLSKLSTRNKTITFMGGGEPTVTWDLFKWAVEYIKTVTTHKKVRIFLTTNATLLNEKRIVWLKENNIHVGVSFDILPEIQNSQRPFPNQINSFDMVDKNIKLLISNGFSFSIRSTITQNSIKKMPEMVEFIHKNYPAVSRLNLEPVTDMEQNQEDFYSKYTEYFFKAKEVGKSYEIDVANSITKSLTSIHTRFCQGEFCVTPKGELVACHRTSSDTEGIFKDFYYGNITSKIEINEKRILAVERMLNTKLVECDFCFSKWHCAGICPNNRLLFSQEQISCYCNFAKTIL